MRHPFEVAKSLIDLRVIKLVHALGPELLDIERRHDGAIDHRPPHRVVVDLALACKITHEAPGERITRSGRIENTLEWIGGRRKVSVLRKQRRAVLAALYDDRFQAEVHYLFRGLDRKSTRLNSSHGYI